MNCVEAHAFVRV